MNILEGIKSNRAPQSKFIIKSKVPTTTTTTAKTTISKQNRALLTEADPYIQYSSMQYVKDFIKYMIDKSTKLQNLIESKPITYINQFYMEHLLENPTLRAALKVILDRMLSSRRLGKKLKGMNKSILQEIEREIWPIVERQALLHTTEVCYQDEKQWVEDRIEEEIEEVGNKMQNFTVQL